MAGKKQAERRLRELREGLDAQLAADGRAPWTGSSHRMTLLAAAVDAVLRAQERGDQPQRTAVRAAVRVSLDVLVERAPGNALEVRVPPYGAVQCLAGPRHTRGTPASVVECAPLTWLALAAGERTWDDARTAVDVQASGTRADLTSQLPLWTHPTGIDHDGQRLC
ncbi:hypothetical protein J4H86_17075 [Spiractinospora alimapuensis]|uniref:sterol carrier family protein n=1 Tax=Spiractinospora alimapuensis TaxID=2820884 RepID=UPI001F237498|nr:sterol carrier family protein [Spiractinospora alimapuensis]QVQ50604.1 hypothetical protein J4H86_17075 [Spiractinospora alimapuensis]